MQHPHARFRQCEGRDEEHAVGQNRENRDGVAERGFGRERADQIGKQRADAAAEIVAKALARSAQPCRIELGEKYAEAKKPSGKPSTHITSLVSGNWV